MRTRIPVKIKPSVIQGYKDFWSDCILVLVVLDKNVSYAQRASGHVLHKMRSAVHPSEGRRAVLHAMRGDYLGSLGEMKRT
jgi:hypothetical protein